MLVERRAGMIWMAAMRAEMRVPKKYVLMVVKRVALMTALMALKICLALSKSECWVGWLAEAMVHSTNLAEKSAEMKAHLKLTDTLRVSHLALQRTKDIPRAGYLSGRKAVMKDARMKLDLHLAVM